MPKRRRRHRRGRFAAVLAVAIATATVGAGRAEVRVNGDAGAVQVDATGSNVAEVLSALGSAFRLHVNAPMALDQPVSGTFTGSLAQVLSRLLQGHNYYIRRQAAEIEVTVIGQGTRAAAVERPQSPAAVAVAPPARTSYGAALPLSQAVRPKNR